MLKIAAFEQGQNRGHVKPEMPRYVKATVPLYHRSNSEGHIEPWEIVNASTLPVEIQTGQRVGIWTPAEIEATGAKENKESAT